MNDCPIYEIFAINSKGETVGHCGLQGFRRRAGGRTWLFYADEQLFTVATGINDEGTITGYYGASNTQGFIKERNGKKVLFSAGTGETEPQAINRNSAVTGFFGGYYRHGFLRTSDGVITQFDVPNSLNTYPSAINASGQIVGFFVDTSQAFVQTARLHAFMRNADGSFLAFDGPGALGGTYPTGINDRGDVVGWYAIANAVHHGFVRTADGTITTFDPDGSEDTTPTAINARGEITGEFIDRTGYHGFIRTR